MPGWTVILWIALGLWYGVWSVVTFAAFALDKHRAVTGGWRISERRLLTLCALGGWPGGLLAMRVVRHKTRVRAFLLLLPGFAITHIFAITLVPHAMKILQ